MFALFHRGQERARDFLVVTTRVVTCHMTLGTEVRPSAKVSGALSF